MNRTVTAKIVEIISFPFTLLLSMMQKIFKYHCSEFDGQTANFLIFSNEENIKPNSSFIMKFLLIS